MMDPLVTGLVLAGVAIVIAIIFYFTSNNEESAFDKAYDEKAKKLMLLTSTNQDKPKQQKNTKSAKKKEQKKADKDSSADEEPATPPQAPAPKTPSPTPTPVEQKSPPKEKVVPPPAVPTKKPEQEKASPSEAKKESTPKPQTANQDDSSKKKKKVSPTKKEEATTPVEPKVVSVQHTKTEASASRESVSAPKKKKREVVNIADLDYDKVVSFFSGIEDVTPEYIGFLVEYYEKHTTQAKALTDSVAQLKQTEADLKKKTDLHQQARLNAEKQLHDQQRILTDLNAKHQLAVTAELMAKAKAEKALQEVEALKASHARSLQAQESASNSKVTAQLESITAENNKKALQISDLETKLADLHEKNASLLKEVQSAQALNQEFTELATVSRQLKADLEERTQQLAEIGQKTAEAEGGLSAQQKAAEGDLAQLRSQYTAEKLDWEKKEKHIMAEYTSLQSLVADLHKEVAKFEEFKKQQDENDKQQKAREAALVAREKEVAAEAARLAEKEREVVIPVAGESDAALQAEVAELNKKLTAALHELEKVKEDNGRALADLRRQLDDKSNEEVVQLKRQNDFLAAPPSDSSNEEVQKLRADNEELQKKNDELRKRNFKILDDVNSLEKRLGNGTVASVAAAAGPSRSNDEAAEASIRRVAEERKLVAESLGSIVNAKSIDTEADFSKYSQWVQNLASSLKGRIEKAEKASAAKKEAPSKAPAGKESELATQVESYRTALSTLAEQLSHIETVAGERSASYEARIKQLEGQLSKANKVISSANRLKSELKECEQLKKQISDLRSNLSETSFDSGSSSAAAVAAGGNGAVAPAARAAASAKSDESDWEVVKEDEPISD